MSPGVMSQGLFLIPTHTLPNPSAVIAKPKGLKGDERHYVIHQISVGPTDHQEIHIRDVSQLETPRKAALSQVLNNQVHTCFDRQERGITRFDRDNH